MQEGVDVDAGDVCAEGGQEPQVADGAKAEVEDFQARCAFEPRTAEHFQWPRVGERGAVFRRPVERVVEIDACEFGLFILGQGRVGGLDLVSFRGVIAVDGARGNHRWQAFGCFQEVVGEWRGDERLEGEGLAS